MQPRPDTRTGCATAGDHSVDVSPAMEDERLQRRPIRRTGSAPARTSPRSAGVRQGHIGGIVVRTHTEGQGDEGTTQVVANCFAVLDLGRDPGTPGRDSGARCGPELWHPFHGQPGLGQSVPGQRSDRSSGGLPAGVQWQPEHASQDPILANRRSNPSRPGRCGRERPS